MPRVVMKVAAVEGPKTGKVRGRIKDDKGTTYQIAPVLLQMVSMGGTYDIDYRDDEFQGKEGLIKFRVVESIVEAGSAAPTPPPARSYDKEQTRPVGSSQTVTPDRDYKDEEIGCYAVMKCMAPVPVDAVEIRHRMVEAAMGIRAFRKWQRSAASDMNDEIPDDR